MKRTNARRRGFTLVELALVMTITIGIGGTIFVASHSLSTAFKTGSSLATLDLQAHETLMRVADLLEQAGPGELDPPTAVTPDWTGTITFKRAVGYTDGDIVWGPIERIAVEQSPSDPDDGVDNDGNGLVDELQLIWTVRPGEADENRHVLVRGVAEFAEFEDPENTTDDNDNQLVNEAGFSLVYDDVSVTVRLTLSRVVSSGVVTQRTFERTIAFLNEGV